MGRSLSTGRGATATALAKRAFLRRFLRPGLKGVLAWVSLSWKVIRGVMDWIGLLRCRWRWGGEEYLVEVGANTTLPVLAEVCTLSISGGMEGVVGVAHGCAGSAGCA